jgi:hypothetical protein
MISRKLEVNITVKRFSVLYNIENLLPSSGCRRFFLERCTISTEISSLLGIEPRYFCHEASGLVMTIYGVEATDDKKEGKKNWESSSTNIRTAFHIWKILSSNIVCITGVPE